MVREGGVKEGFGKEVGVYKEKKKVGTGLREVVTWGGWSLPYNPLVRGNTF